MNLMGIVSSLILKSKKVHKRQQSCWKCPLIFNKSSRMVKIRNCMKADYLTMLPHVKKYSILINLSTRLLQFVKILKWLPVAMDSMNKNKIAAAERLNLMSSLRLISCLHEIILITISYTPQGLDLYFTKRRVVNVRAVLMHYASGKLKNQFLGSFSIPTRALSLGGWNNHKKYTKNCCILPFRFQSAVSKSYTCW